MFVSVIIPAYNCVNTLEVTIDSIMKSGLKDYEIIMIDDGSKDGTSNLCDSLSEDIDIIRCIHQDNSGVSSARNRGIEEARGEYVFFFDSDDTVDEKALIHASKILYQNKPDMLIFGLSFDYYYHRRLYRRDPLVYHKEGLIMSPQWGNELQKLFMSNALSPAWNKLIRRDLLVRNNIRFDQKLIDMEDFLFTINCLKFCETVYLLPEEIYRYRQAEDGKSTYKRLLRVDSLTEYMEPFEKGLKELAERLMIDEKNKRRIISIASQIYNSYFYEMILYGSIKVIRDSSNDMLGGPYRSIIKKNDPVLYKRIKHHKYCRIWLRSLKKRLRHWVAVRIKYILSYGGLL